MFPIQQLLRMKFEADSGVPAGGSGSAGSGTPGTAGGSTPSPTDPPANITPGAGGQSGQAGSGSGAPTPGQNGGTNPNPQQPTTPTPPVAKYTDEDMKNARLRFEAEAKEKSDKAAEAARIKEAEEQGNFKKAHEEMKPKFEAATAKVERYQPLLETWLNESVAEWPEKLKAKIDAESDFDRKLDLFEDLRDIAADFAAAQGGERKPPMTTLTHIPQPGGTGGTTPNQVRPVFSNYKGPKQPGKSN